MNFPHEDPEFSNLLRIVADKRELGIGLVEKDYWVTHTLWALHEAEDLEIWFKGGTSLSKGFGLIQRFSEDLDLRIDSQAAGVASTAWPKKPSKAQVVTRRDYFTKLSALLVVPGADVSLIHLDEDGRGADYEVSYRGQFLETVLPPNSPFVKLEVGRALVAPFVECNVTSFVHEELAAIDELSNYRDNRPQAVRCVHPRVTLLEKLDAIAWRFEKEREPAEFIRHYEDAAKIIDHDDVLPPLPESTNALAASMSPHLRLRRVAEEAHPAFSAEAVKLSKLQDAYEAISPMFWSERLPLNEACARIRGWLHTHFPG